MLSALTLTLTFSPISNCFAAVPERLSAKTLESSPTVAAPLTAEAKKARVSEQFGKLPLHFEPNRGQTDKRVEYLSRGQGYTLMLTRREAILSLSASDGKGAAVRMKTVGSNGRPEIVAEGEQEGRSNYFLGNDRSKWQSHVPHYGRMRYRGVYPGIDQVYYGKQGQLEYDFVVAPGADPNQINLRFDGIERLKVDGQGDLLMEIAGGGELKQSRPVVYQEINGERREIAARFDVRGKREVGFELGTYDQGQPVVIDPVLAYSTYLGGSDTDKGLGIAVDKDGNAYVTGHTASDNFPTTMGAFQTTTGVFGYNEAFVTKLKADGSGLVYSTYLGGVDDDYGYGITVDGSGSVYLTGETRSYDFPVTMGALQTTFGGFITDAFVTKLKADGSALEYSTFLGGTEDDYGYGITVDSSGSVYLTGETYSTDFPITMGAFQTTHGGSYSDAFVSKLKADGSALIYSTYLGGNSVDSVKAITIDGDGNAYLAGETQSTNYPTTIAAYQTTFAGGADDAFVTKLKADGSGLVYSTFIGGSASEKGNGITVDGSGNAYLTGYTGSNNFPTTMGAYQTTPGGTNDAYVTKLKADGSGLVYSTFIGGSQFDIGRGITLDNSGNVYLTGSTASNNFPTTMGAYQTTIGGYEDAFVTKLKADGSNLEYSTFLGGAGTDWGRAITGNKDGIVYLIGHTTSNNFPTTTGAYQTTRSSSFDAFITKLNLSSGPACPMMSLSPASLPMATYGATYPDQLMAVSGAVKPMTFAFTKGVLPPWMMLSSTGFLSGSLVQNLGTYTFTIAAKDDGGCEVSQDYTVTSKLSPTSALCLKDDDNARKTMSIDFATGNYMVTSGAQRLSGTGVVTVTDGQLRLRDSSSGNRVYVTVNRFDGKGEVIVSFALPTFPVISISDANVTDNGCAVRP